jgi:hypothetical protein
LITATAVRHPFCLPLFRSAPPRNRHSLGAQICLLQVGGRRVGGLGPRVCRCFAPPFAATVTRLRAIIRRNIDHGLLPVCDSRHPMIRPVLCRFNRSTTRLGPLFHPVSTLHRTGARAIYSWLYKWSQTGSSAITIAASPTPPTLLLLKTECHGPCRKRRLETCRCQNISAERSCSSGPVPPLFVYFGASLQSMAHSSPMAVRTMTSAGVSESVTSGTTYWCPCRPPGTAS